MDMSLQGKLMLAMAAQDIQGSLCDNVAIWDKTNFFRTQALIRDTTIEIGGRRDRINSNIKLKIDGECETNDIKSRAYVSE